MAVYSLVGVDETTSDFRLDAEHYQPRFIQQGRALRKLSHKRMEDVASVSDGNHLTIAEQFTSEGVRYLRGQDLSDFFISDADPLFIPAESYDLLRRSHMRPGDVLVSIVGTIGSIGLVTDRHSRLTGSCKLAIVRPRGLPGEYIAAYLSSRVGQAEIQRTVRGAVQMGVILPDIRAIPIPLPPPRMLDVVVERVRSAQRERANAGRHYDEAEALLLETAGLDAPSAVREGSYVRSFDEVSKARRLDAEYFSPRYRDVLARLRARGVTIGEAAPATHRRFQARPGSMFNYVEIGGLSGHGEATSEPVDGGSAPSRAQWVVSAGDVVTSMIRPIRRLSALIGPTQGGSVCSSGFVVLRPKLLEPEVLLVYLRAPIIAEILDLHTTASMYPAISEERLLGLPIALPGAAVRTQIAASVQASFAARRDATRLLHEASDILDQHVAAPSTRPAGSA